MQVVATANVTHEETFTVDVPADDAEAIHPGMIVQAIHEQHPEELAERVVSVLHWRTEAV